ncbi:YbaB/EbfC family nucleoid-associated protein [Kribbella sp. NPDC056861]|uniref:YbaB/EbfC family nucleoid-associated protein n=1 Tax=Kribbella sp. NPDC056861 TaxID=3154857 RepID=UPI00343EB8DD
MVSRDQVPGTAYSLLGQLDEADREIRRFRALSDDTTGTAQSPDGLVEATVGLYGEVRELVLDPRVYRSPDAEALAGRIRDVINEAVQDAQKSAAEQLPALFPAGSDDPSALAFEPFLTAITDARKAGR